MTTTPIEAGARAIYEARNGNGCKPWSLQTKSHKEPYLSDAKVCIDAIRQLDLSPAGGDYVVVPRDIFIKAKCPCDARYTIGECQQCGCSLGLYAATGASSPNNGEG